MVNNHVVSSFIN